MLKCIVDFFSKEDKHLSREALIDHNLIDLTKVQDPGYTPYEYNDELCLNNLATQIQVLKTVIDELEDRIKVLELYGN